jgi:hypothetical protein
MILVTTQTTAPVPPLLREVRVDKDPALRYLAIRFIPGLNFEERWSTLSWRRNLIVVWTLRYYVHQFRKIPLENRPPAQLETVRKFTTVSLLLKYTYAQTHPLMLGQWELTTMLTSTNRARDPGHLQPMQKCPPGSHTNRSFLTGSTVPTQTRPHSIHLCRWYSPTSTSPRNLSLDEGNRLWVIDFELSGFYPQWSEYAGMLPTWSRFTYHRWVAAAAGNYRKQRGFLLDVNWAVNVGHLIQ